MANYLRIDQTRDTPMTSVQGSNFIYRYAYSRSSDSVNGNEKGQDYIAIIGEDHALAFVLCDGVSQSFYGDLAASVLGDELVHWLWRNGDVTNQDNNDFSQGVSNFLMNLTEQATKLVEEFPLSEEISPMLKSVLDKKRNIGSESMFVAGYINMVSKTIFLAWMGDCRLRIWKGADKNKEIDFDDGDFNTKERWSTRKGLIGSLHTKVFTLQESLRIMTYSDGLARIDRKIDRGSPSNKTLDKLIEESRLLPASDDISFLEIQVRPLSQIGNEPDDVPQDVKVNYFQKNNQLNCSWHAVKNANSYDIAVKSSRGLNIYSSEDPIWESLLSQLPNNLISIKVRAWFNGDVGDWSPENIIQQIPGLPEKPNIENLDQEQYLKYPEHDIQPVSIGSSEIVFHKHNSKRKHLRKILIAFILFFFLLFLSVMYGRLFNPPNMDEPVDASITPISEIGFDYDLKLKDFHMLDRKLGIIKNCTLLE